MSVTFDWAIASIIFFDESKFASQQVNRIKSQLLQTMVKEIFFVTNLVFDIRFCFQKWWLFIQTLYDYAEMRSNQPNAPIKLWSNNSNGTDSTPQSISHEYEIIE